MSQAGLKTRTMFESSIQPCETGSNLQVCNSHTIRSTGGLQQGLCNVHAYTGATLTSKEKLDIARQLSKLGVDIIEAGFPVASPDDFEAVRSIALDVGNAVDEDGYVPVICGLSRYLPPPTCPAPAIITSNIVLYLDQQCMSFVARNWLKPDNSHGL